jgi:hypothetical protein
VIKVLKVILVIPGTQVQLGLKVLRAIQVIPGTQAQLDLKVLRAIQVILDLPEIPVFKATQGQLGQLVLPGPQGQLDQLGLVI